MNNKNDRTQTDQEIMNILTSLEWQEKPFSKPIVNIIENNETQVHEKFENKVSNSETLKLIVNNNLPEITDQANISINGYENIPEESFDSFNRYSIDEQAFEIEEENSLFRRSSGNKCSKVYTCNTILENDELQIATKNKSVIFEDLTSDDQKSIDIFKNKNIDKDLKSEKQNNSKNKVFPNRYILLCCDCL